MTLTELWSAVARGDSNSARAAYLHRVMRERGSQLIKGQHDVMADWQLVIGQNGGNDVVVDLGDMAVVRIGDTAWHHWVCREDGRISFEMLIAADQTAMDSDAKLVVERSITARGQTAELFHWFNRSRTGLATRRTGSKIIGGLALAIGEPVANG